MSKIIDSTRQSMGWNNPWETRTVNQIRNIGIHHSATVSGTRQAFENNWRAQGWRNGGYSEIIHQNGDVELCYVPTTVTNGVSNHNTSTYHICVVGNFRTDGAQPTTAQRRVLLERIRFNVNRFANVNFDRVFGHNEFSGHASNICPGQNMSNIRRDARQSTSTPTPPANNATTHTVRSGETLSGIARQHSTTVKAIQDLNNIKNANVISVGQVLRLPTGSTDSTSTDQTWRVGDTVRRLGTNSKWYDNGQAVPQSIRDRAHQIMEIRGNRVVITFNGAITGAIDVKYLRR